MPTPQFLFFGFIAGPDDLRRAYAGDPTPQVSAVKFQTGLIEGFASHGRSLHIVSSLPIASYPRSKTLVVRKARFSLGLEGVSGLLMGTINLPIVKLVLRTLTSFYHGVRLLASGGECVAVVVYPLHTPYMLAAIVLKRLFRQPVYVFIPDLPLHTGGTDLKGAHGVLKRIDDRLLKALVARADMAFPITEEMARSWLPSSVKYLVVEGIAPESRPAVSPAPTGHARPRILYTGQFSHILNFARMFASRPEIDAELVFVGGGPDLEGLRELARKDTRIVTKPFAFGEALECEFADADFLLNPRDTRWEGARLSFPSKLHDYMARRRPILSTRMPGIPAEYFDCFLKVRDEDADALAASLQRALAAPPDEIAARIETGETMLNTSKSAQAVTGRILEAMARC